jgi:hypothetical protein
VAWLIGNRDYSEVRRSGKDCEDIEQMDDDIAKMKVFCDKLGFKVIVSKDCDMESIEEGFRTV